MNVAPRYPGRIDCKKNAWFISRLQGSLLEGNRTDSTSLLAAKRECRMRNGRAALNVSERSKTNRGLLTGMLSLQHIYISFEKIPIKRDTHSNPLSSIFP